MRARLALLALTVEAPLAFASPAASEKPLKFPLPAGPVDLPAANTFEREAPQLRGFSGSAPAEPDFDRRGGTEHWSPILACRLEKRRLEQKIGHSQEFQTKI